MSLLRLTYIITLLLVYSNSQAQQDSAISNKETISSRITQTENILQHYKVRKDSTINSIDSLSAKKAGKVEKITSKFNPNKDSIITTANSIASKELNKAGKTISKYDKKSDSLLNTLQEIPSKYFKQVDKKLDKYSSRITSKTEKTLAKLSRWENKIKKLLDKASPETSAKLFGKNQLTFSSLLQKIKEGQNFAAKTEAEYNGYRDKLTTGIKYIESQKDKLDSDFIKPVSKTSDKINQLDQDVANSEAIQKIIKERKKQLLNESVKYIGKSKYLSRINKESYYYSEKLRNYKEIFSDKKKAEQTALTILNKIPAFKKFTKENSALASLFGTKSNYGTAQNLTGLQTRESINDIIQEKIATGGPNAKEMITQQMQQAQGELNKLKDKLSKYGSGGGADEMPDFKPNKQKTKTFTQRLEYGSNFQFGKGNSFLPATADIGLSLGYKLNDKSIIGIGAAYKMGMGSIERIRISHQGIGLRGFGDWKLKKQFFVSGGFEMNHNDAFKSFSQLKQNSSWQQSALVGITKKIKMKTKLLKGTSIQLMYDFLSNQHVPVSQPFVFRTGYTF